MDNIAKGTKKRSVLISLLALLAICGVCLTLYWGSQRHRLFHFDPAKVESITIRSQGGQPGLALIADKKEVGEIIDLLNNFQYTSTEEVPSMLGWDYTIEVITTSKEAFITTNIAFDAHYIRGGRSADDTYTLYYSSSPDYLQPLLDIARGKRKSLTE